MKLRRAFMWSMIVSLSICALAGIVVLLFPRLPFEEEVLASAALVGLYSLLAMVCAIAIERRRRAIYAVIGALGISLSLVALAFFLFEIWTTGSSWPNDTRLKIGFSASLLALNAAHLGLYAPARIAGAARWIKLAAVIFASLFCMILVLFIWLDPHEEFVARGMGVIGILALLTSTITPLAWKMQSLHQREHATPTIGASYTIKAECPRCGLDQHLPPRKAKCTRCKLDINIEIQEPRCTCGYPFLGLRADKCPECGRPIPEQDRWAMTAPPQPPPPQQAPLQQDRSQRDSSQQDR